MKIIKLQGGLGNQLFQYAYGRSLEIMGKRIVFDVSFFGGNRPRVDTAWKFKLENFNIKTKAIFSGKKHYFHDLFIRIKRRLGFSVESYFQSEKYFENIKDAIREEFKLKNPISSESQKWSEKIKNSLMPISLHIRRGDYISNPKTKEFHGVCDTEYYKKAIELLNKKIGKFDIFVFSDDIDWAKKNINFTKNIYFVSNSKMPDYEELYLMSLCKHNIIANSSFSWWGAWLNQNPDKIVLAPKNWFAKIKIPEDLIPTKWIKI
jgi:hypothetical protein